MKLKKHEAPFLNDLETTVLQMVCRYYMMEKPFNELSAARLSGIPVWSIKLGLKKLAAQKLITIEGKQYIPAMQINGAPIPKPEIYFENGVKIIRCPRMYAEGYARMRNLQ